MTRLKFLSFAVSVGEKKEEEEPIGDILQGLAPLPQKRTSDKARAPAKKIPGSHLTGERVMAFVHESEKGLGRGARAKKPVKKLQEEAQEPAQMEEEEDVVFLGQGPTKLLIIDGEEGFRCLICKKPWSAKNQDMKWVQCKSCAHPQHSKCMGRARKCPCGALAPKGMSKPM